MDLSKIPRLHTIGPTKEMLATPAKSFHSLRLLTSLILIGYGAQILLIILWISQAVFFHIGFTQGDQNTARAVAFGLLRSLPIVGHLSLAMSGCHYVAFLAWIYQAYANLPSLAYRNSRFAPWLVVVLMLIPIANMFFVFLILNEIAKASEPQRLSGYGHRDDGVNVSVLIFWLMNLWSAGLIFYLLYRALAGITNEDELVKFGLMQAVTLVFTMLPMFFAMKIFNEICQNQEVRRQIALNLPPLPTVRSS